MKVSGWSAYYSGGSIYSSKDTAISALPSTGMLVWMLYFDNGTRRIMHGNDTYFWFNDGSEEGIFASNDDLPEEINARYSGAKIILGELVSDNEMKSTLSSAFAKKII